MCREDIKEFSSLLKEHQMALLSDGFTVLESAALQHNIRSVSKLYRNISVDQLGLLLGLPEAKVESLACDMISEGRLLAYIDQVRPCVATETLCFDFGRPVASTGLAKVESLACDMISEGRLLAYIDQVRPFLLSVSSPAI